MDKRTEFNNALKDALRSKDKIAMSTIRLIVAALKDRDIEARGKGNADGISEAEILSMMQSMIKQRQESSKPIVMPTAPNWRIVKKKRSLSSSVSCPSK